MTYMECERKIIEIYKNIDSAYKKAFIYAFLLINLAFLFHTVNFMHGDHDWAGVRKMITWKDGAFEGRPFHHLFQAIFFGGQILPILNNLLSFGAMALSGILLAIYWKLKKNIWLYTLFSTFIATLPFTLVWLYFAKDTLANLTLPLTLMITLLIADRTYEKQSLKWHGLVILLFFYNFSNYVAIINMIGVCVIGKMLIEYAETKKNIVQIVRQQIILALDVVIALALFKITLHFCNLTSDYNTKIISLDILGDKIIETIMVMFTQFTVVLPFMEYKYKILLLILSIFGFSTLFIKAGISKCFPTLILVLLMLFASKFAYFIADERGEILTQMENFAYLPRLDFYGLAYIYAFALRLVLDMSITKWQKVGIVLATVITFMSMVRDMYAQKVWKFGFEAEMKAHERVIMRIEQNPQFHTDRKYRIYSVGTLSLRKNYYKKQKNEETSLDLLETPYMAEFFPLDVYNFYYPKDTFYSIATEKNLSPMGIDYILNKAKPWPSLDSIYIDNDIIIIVLNEEKLNKLKEQLNNNFR